MNCRSGGGMSPWRRLVVGTVRQGVVAPPVLSPGGDPLPDTTRKLRGFSSAPTVTDHVRTGVDPRVLHGQFNSLFYFSTFLRRVTTYTSSPWSWVRPVVVRREVTCPLPRCGTRDFLPSPVHKTRPRRSVDPLPRPSVCSRSRGPRWCVSWG